MGFIFERKWKNFGSEENKALKYSLQSMSKYQIQLPAHVRKISPDSDYVYFFFNFGGPGFSRKPSLGLVLI